MSETAGGGGEGSGSGGGPSGPSGGDHASDVSLSSSSESTHTTTQSGGPDVTTVVQPTATTPVTTTPELSVSQSTTETVNKEPIKPSAFPPEKTPNGPDSSALEQQVGNAKASFNENAPKTSEKTTVLPKKGQEDDSRQRRSDQFWKARVPDANVGKGMATMTELNKLNAERAKLETHAKLTPGDLNEQDTNTKIEQDREDRIEYLKERLTRSHQTFENDFNRNRANFVKDGQDRKR